jgi:hypothetical protein
MTRGAFVPDDLEHPALIVLPPVDFFDEGKRYDHIAQIKSWCDELTSSQPGRYYMDTIIVENDFYVWFKDQGDAVTCILRWL